MDLTDNHYEKLLGLGGDWKVIEVDLDIGKLRVVVLASWNAHLFNIKEMLARVMPVDTFGREDPDCSSGSAAATCCVD